ncbi:MAG: helix-turn-helix domain-containing protein [Clostridia bacterium]|nr:helix-turn-helix domain-containing protein [Clostridia bacterium]
MLENFKFNLFIKLLLIYICIFLFPFIILGSMLTQFTINEYKNEVLKYGLDAVSYIRYLIDDNLSDVDAVRVQLAKDQFIRGFINNTDASASEKVYDAKQAAEEINRYRVYRNSIYRLDLYCRKLDCVVTNTSVYTRQEYYNTFMADSQISFEDWSEILFNPDENTKLFASATSSIEQSTVTLAKPLFKDINGEVQATLLVLLDPGNITDNFRRISASVPVTYFAIASDGELLMESQQLTDGTDMASLLSQNKEQFELPNRNIAVCSQSSVTNLKYVCIVSEAEILSNVSRNKMLLLWFIVIFSVILVILAFFFSGFTFSPIKPLMSLGGTIESVKEYRNLILNVVNSNIKLSEAVSRQKCCIDNNIFRMFLQNSMELDDESLNMLFEDMPVSADSKYFRAMVILPLSHDYDEVTSLTVVPDLYDGFRESGAEFCVIPCEGRQIVLLVACNDAKEKLGAPLQKTFSHIIESKRLNISVGLGRTFEELKEFSKSYEDAFFALKPDKCGVSSSNNARGVFFGAYFGRIKKEKIISCVWCGDAEGVERCFEELTSGIFADCVITYRMQNHIRYLLGEIFREAIAAKKAHNAELAAYEEECVKAAEMHNFAESIEVICSCYVRAAKSIGEYNKTEHEDIVDDVIRYIENNYMDYDISLKQIAGEVHVSYNYISEAIKKRVGTTFLNYLHEIRIEKAKQLLLTTELTVADIAERVGYNSSNTFIKTFKKVSGITPGEYRKNGK